MPLKHNPFSLLVKFVFAGFFLFLAVSPISLNAQAANSNNPFRLGPSLDEEEDKEEPADINTSPFHFDQNQWNQMRQRMDQGLELGTTQQAVDTSTKTVEKPKDAPGQLKVDLPYESSLSVTGRKVIKVEIKNTHITSERAEELGTSQDTQSFNMEQELQARIQGTVARKTTINVNFDDTKDNVRDFSVVYKGDPDEVVQEAAFGDIVLSLPSTEFVNYNKQLFGIRAALKYKRAGLLAIGSRTKGNTETKRFTGTTSRQQIFVNDTSYIRRKFFDLTFSTATALIGAGGPLNGISIIPINDANPEVVLIEDTTGLDPEASNFAIVSPTAPTVTTTISMKRLSRGVDYSIDAVEGIITFVNALSEDVRVAVDFTMANGARIKDQIGAGADAVLIKDKNPVTAGVSQEIKRFYSAGARNIVRDNGLGNFVFRVLDQNRETDIGDTLSPLQRYPDTINMEFETGIFELDERLPFSDVYLENVNTGSALNAVFSLEYQSVVRTYTLRPNIVLQSERVEVDGRVVNRDLDYFIDYDIGIITFFSDDLIRESTVIEVTYEFAPFGGQLGETLVGARGTFDIFDKKEILGVEMDKWSVGSTVLFNFAAKPSAPPDVRSAPSSLLVTEGDTQLKGVKFGKLPFLTDFSFERANSKENPNLFGKALIDSMDGIKQEDNASLIEEAWQVASNPQFSNANGTYNNVVDFRHISFFDEDLQTFEAGDEGTIRGLRVNYDLNTANTTTPEQSSIVQVLSFGGRDFSKKTTLEIEIEGAGSSGSGTGVDLIVDYGSFNEDADGDGVLDTEDEIPLDGILNLGEDNGFQFDGPGDDLSIASSADNTLNIIGSGNTRLDSEDLNSDQVLATQDFPATFTPLFRLSDSHVSRRSDGTTDTISDLEFSGRRLVKIPLNLSALSAEEQARLTAVRQVRITVRNGNPATTSKSGSFAIARLSIVGISWEPSELEPTTALSTMTVRAVNNKDDTVTYGSLIGNPAYNSLYGSAAPSTGAEEQALALDYVLAAGSTATTKNTFGAPRDFSKHEEFRFFLSKRDVQSGSCVPTPGDNTSCGIFFLQAGSETEFQQVTINVADIPVASPSAPNWLLVTIRQIDANKDGAAETWVANTPGAVVSLRGNVPDLAQVSQLKAGVYNPTGGNISDEVRLNEIHLSDPKERNGEATKIAFDTAWTNWGTVGGSRRKVDRLFQTPTTQITNQDRTQESAYLNVDRLSFLPMTFKVSRDETITPSAFQSNANALVSFIEEGRVENVNRAATAKLILPKLPIFDFAVTTSDTENTVTQRTESSNEVRVGASYSPPTRFDLLAGDTLSFRPIPTSITANYSRKETKLRFPGVEQLVRFGISTAAFNSTDLTQFSDNGEVRMAFNPWNGFTMNPTYKLRVDKERRDFRADERTSASQVVAIDGVETPRSLSQTASVSGNFRILKWLQPRYSYSVTGTETNGLPTLSDTTAYLRKTIVRNSQGELSGTVQVVRALPKTRLFKSMTLNSSYKLENGDTYQDVPEDFDWRSDLWVGTPLDIPTSTNTTNGARRTDLTDRRTFRTNTSWLPFSAYNIGSNKLRPLTSLSLTSNFLTSTEDTETTGTSKRVESRTWPDLILTINDTEDFFGIKRVLDDSRLVLKTNTRKVETVSVSKSRNDTFGADYQFKLVRKLDFSTSINFGDQKEDNLITNQITSRSKTKGYSIQTRIPWASWSFTPRYERNETDARDSVRKTNDLVAEVYSLQIYGDVNRPFGVRFGRREIGFANRLILNSTIKWDKKRSSINPQTNFIDIYSASLSGDYTINKNFRLAVGGSFALEEHHPDFDKLDKTEFAINSTLTIQF